MASECPSAYGGEPGGEGGLEVASRKERFSASLLPPEKLRKSSADDTATLCGSEAYLRKASASAVAEDRPELNLRKSSASLLRRDGAA